jgi:myotubularin-related protein 5/13
VWDYYVKEDLAHGPSYDLEAIEKETRIEEEQRMIDGPFLPNPRKVINGCYDNIEAIQPDMMVHLLQVCFNSTLDVEFDN